MSSRGFVVEAMTAEHADRVLEIYAEGIAGGDSTFETSAPDWGEWDAEHLDEPRLIVRDGDRVLGWSALSPVSDRCVYGGVAEVSVYVAQDSHGRGVGALLLNGLVAAAETAGIWTLQAGIFPENEASLRLHEHCGFRVVGRRERLGRMAGRWRDVMILERRSSTVGVD